MKKLVVRLCQSTLRRFITSASTGTPCTSKVSVPPTRTPKYFAASSSTDTRGRLDASSAVHQRPRVSAFAGGGAADHVSMYSRVRYQILSGVSRLRRSMSSRVTGVPSIAASRARTIGVIVGAAPPVTSPTSRLNGSRWSGCTSMKKNAGASRFCS